MIAKCKTIVGAALQWLFETMAGYIIVSTFVRATGATVFHRQTYEAMRLDLARLRARRAVRRASVVPVAKKLHFGAGKRQVKGWLNVDVAGSEFDIDLVAASGLPWDDNTFDSIVSQHVVEHIDLEQDLLHLFRELHRASKPNAEIWLSCSDLEKVCRGYCTDRGMALKLDRKTRFTDEPIGETVPTQHYINFLFHQNGQHKNLFDLELLQWALTETGFDDCRRLKEQDFLARFPEFPVRGDDMQSLYVRATAVKVTSTDI